MFGFLNTTLLLGLIGVIVPLLIHLFARQKVQKIYFSSTMFLRRIQNQYFRQITLRQLLLLFLRTMAILFIVLAFGRPTLRRAGMFTQGQAKSSAVILLDRSISMSRGNVIHRARTQALQVCDFMRNHDEAALLLSNPRVDDVPYFSRDFNGLQKTIQKVEAGYERGPLIADVQEAQELLQYSHNLNREIYFISDFQASGFSGQLDTNQIYHELNRLFLLPIQGGSENVAILSGGVENQILHPNSPIRLFAEVKNFGEKVVKSLLVRIFLEGDAVAQQMIEIEPGETQRVSFQTVIRKTGWISGSIQIDRDPFLPDNQWFFTFRIPDDVTVYLFGRNDRDVNDIALALTMEKKELYQFYKVHSIFMQKAWPEDIKNVDVLLFSNYPRFQTNEIEEIKRFLKNGKGIGFILGSDIDLRNYNESVMNPLLEISLGGTIQDEVGTLSFDVLDFKHPLFMNVFEEGKEKLQSPRFSKVVEVVGKNPQPIISLSNGYPFLIEKEFEGGRVLIVCSGIDPSWSNLKYSTFFAPLIHRLVLYLANDAIQTFEGFTVGSTVSVNTDSIHSDLEYYAINPIGRRINLIPEFKNDQVLLTFTQTTEPGIYQFYSGQQMIEEKAVNVDRHESDFQTISKGIINKSFHHLNPYWISEDESLGRIISSVRWGRELWKEFLLLGLVVLLIEMVIARVWKEFKSSS